LNKEETSNTAPKKISQNVHQSSEADIPLSVDSEIAGEACSC